MESVLKSLLKTGMRYGTQLTLVIAVVLILMQKDAPQGFRLSENQNNDNKIGSHIKAFSDELKENNRHVKASNNTNKTTNQPKVVKKRKTTKLKIDYQTTNTSIVPSLVLGGNNETYTEAAPAPKAVTVSHVAKETSETAKVATKAPKKAPVVIVGGYKAFDAYIARFKKVALVEQEKFGIPVYITLGQGLLESSAGQSRLAAENNNHFGIKCFGKKCVEGHCINYKDDSSKDYFRKFGTAWESFRAHSQFLQKDRYKSLYKLDVKDYKAWANGLQKAGYATDKGYAKKLISVIERMKLNEL